MRALRCVFCGKNHDNMLDNKCQVCAKEFKEIKEKLSKDCKYLPYINNVIPFRVENRK